MCTMFSIHNFSSRNKRGVRPGGHSDRAAALLPTVCGLRTGPGPVQVSTLHSSSALMLSSVPVYFFLRLMTMVSIQTIIVMSGEETSKTTRQSPVLLPVTERERERGGGRHRERERDRERERERHTHTHTETYADTTRTRTHACMHLRTHTHTAFLHARTHTLHSYTHAHTYKHKDKHAYTHTRIHT